MGAIGLALRPPQGPHPFDPRLLFARGEAGAWYDPGDASSMFADDARTIPAAIDGPVGGMADLSGRGHHLAQPAPAARPILRRDETGRRFLDFDGADDWLASQAAGLRITGPLTLAAAVQRTNDARYDIWLSAQTQAAMANQYELRTDPAGVLEFVAADADQFEADQAGAGAAVPVGAARIVTATRTSGAIDFTVSGVASSATHMIVPTVDAASEFRLGGRKGVPLFARGRIYGSVIIGRILTTTELAGLQTWLAARIPG